MKYPWEIFIGGIQGFDDDGMPIRDPQERERCARAAYEELKAMSGQDFGRDVARWEAWFADESNGELSNEENERLLERSRYT